MLLDLVLARLGGYFHAVVEPVEDIVPGPVVSVYTGRVLTRSTWSGEHVVPKSWYGTRHDIANDERMLVPADRDANAARGNRALIATDGYNDAARGLLGRITLLFDKLYGPGVIRSADRREYKAQLALARRWARLPVGEYERERTKALRQRGYKVT